MFETLVVTLASFKILGFECGIFSGNLLYFDNQYLWICQLVIIINRSRISFGVPCCSLEEKAMNGPRRAKIASFRQAKIPEKSNPSIGIFTSTCKERFVLVISFSVVNSLYNPRQAYHSMLLVYVQKVLVAWCALVSSRFANNNAVIFAFRI